MKKTSQPLRSGKVRLLSALFFISGLAALLYQTCWQRLLFLILGSNIEAVTVVVSVFILAWAGRSRWRLSRRSIQP